MARKSTKSTSKKTTSRRKPASGRSRTTKSTAAKKSSPTKSTKAETASPQSPRLTLDRKLDIAGIVLAFTGLLTLLSLLSASRSVLTSSWVSILPRHLWLGHLHIAWGTDRQWNLAHRA